jgi:predicted transcriptional regulator
MSTLQITGDSPRKRTKTKSAERTPPCQYTTVEDFRDAVSEGMEALGRGDVISQEDLEKEMLSW